MLYKLFLPAILLLAFGSTAYSASQDEAAESAAEVTESEMDSSSGENDTALEEEQGGDSHAEEHEAGHGEHELDPSHMNLSDSGEDAASWRTDKAIASLIVFGLLLLGLNAVAWKPISEGLAKREKTIASNIANAEQASKEAMEKLASYESKIASANEEAQKILADARKDAEASGQRLVAAAQEEAAKQRERAVVEIETAKQVALGELSEKSTDMAISLAKRIVGREVNPSDHQNLIQDMLSNLPSRN